MAKDQDIITFRCNVKWWVQPFLTAAGRVLMVLRPFMSEDRLDSIIGAVARSAVNRGVSFSELRKTG